MKAIIEKLFKKLHETYQYNFNKVHISKLLKNGSKRQLKMVMLQLK